MAKETRVEQVAPRQENEMIQYYARFGWEVHTNQRCQERRGDTLYTFNRITFTRDKSAPWYKRACELEEEYNDVRTSTYDQIKYKYNYNEKSKLGERPAKPIKPKYPNVAEPKLFYKSLRTLIIFIALSLVFMFLSKNDAFTVQIRDILQFLTRACLIVSGVGLIITLIRIKYLTGLKGEEKEKAITKYNKDIKSYEKKKAELKSYNESIEQFMINREKEILKELDSIIE